MRFKCIIGICKALSENDISSHRALQTFKYNEIARWIVPHLAQTVKKPLESSRGLAALSTLIAPSDMCGGRVDIFAPGNPIFQSKNIFLAVSTPGNPQDFSGNCVGVAVAGEILPRPRLAKRIF